MTSDTPGPNRELVSLRATSLARFVALTVAGADVIFSDNFFDLPAGREVAVCAPLPSGWDLARFQEALQIRHGGLCRLSCDRGT